MYEGSQETLISRSEPAELAVALPFDMSSLAESIRSSASMIDSLQDTSEADLAAERERMRQISTATHRTIGQGLSLQAEQKNTYLHLQDEIEAYVGLCRVRTEARAAQVTKEAQLEERRTAQHDLSIEARQVNQQKQAAAAEEAYIDRFVQNRGGGELQEQQTEAERLMGIWADQSGIAAREDRLRNVLLATALEIGTLEEEIATIVQHELPELEIEIDKRQAAIQALIQKIYGLSAQIERLQPPAKDPATQYLFATKATGQSAVAESVVIDKADTVASPEPPKRHPRTLEGRVLGLDFVYKPDGALSRAVVRTKLERVQQ